MHALLIFIHAVAAVCLILVILMQSGRGGGLTEGFAPAESLFGAKTNQFMVRTTIAVAVVFLITSLSLAYLSSKRAASLIPEDVSSETPPAEADLPQIPEEAQEATAAKPVQPSTERPNEVDAGAASAPAPVSQTADEPGEE